MATPMTEPDGRGVDGADDRVGRAGDVAELDHLVRGLGVDHHDAVGVLGAEGLDVLGPEALVHRAVALPQEQRRLLHLAVGEAADGLTRVPDAHVVGPVAELVAGVAAQVLVREEEDPVARAPGPRSGRPGRWTTCTRRRPSGPRTP